MRDTKVKVLVEIALSVALSIVLGLWQIALPVNINGGSISLAMLPVIVVALRRGALAGAVAGGLYGSLDLILGKAYILHWAQVLLDYPLPYLLLGLVVGLFSMLYLKRVADEKRGHAIAIAAGAITLGVLSRYVAHVLSGAIFFAEYAEGLNPWVYSLVYNVTYMLPSFIVCLLAALIVLPALDRAVPVQKEAPLDASVASSFEG